MKRSSVSLTLAVALITGRSTAQSAAQDDPVLAALVQQALDKNPDVLAARASVLAARQRPAQARALPDPMLQATYTNDGWAPSLGTMPMTTLALMWSQELPWPGKRGLRGQLAEREADAVEPQLRRTLLSLEAQLRRAYADLLLSRELLGLVAEQENAWREIEGAARARYSVGQGAQQDVLRAQIELTRIEQLRTEQALIVEIRVAELNRLAARSSEATLDTAARLQLDPFDQKQDVALARAVDRSPELRVAAAAIERERVAVAISRKDFKPDFTVQGGYMNRGALDPMWQAGASITLPIYKKRRESALAEAEARLRAAEQQLESIRLQLRFRTEERLAQLRSAESLVTLYEKGIVPQDQMSVEAAIASYQAGKLPFLTVLEALVTLYGDRTTQLQLVAAHAKTRASVEEASLDATSAAMPAGRGFGGMSGQGAAVGGGAASPGAAFPGALGSMGR